MNYRRRLTSTAGVLLFLGSGACEEPNAEQQRFVTEDGRIAIGVSPPSRRTPVGATATVSDAMAGERRYLEVCDSAGNPRSILLFARPDLADSATARPITGGADHGCASELVLIWTVARFDGAADAVRVEALDRGQLGWISSDELARAIGPEECPVLYAADAERQSRCREGPPLWPRTNEGAG